MSTDPAKELPNASDAEKSVLSICLQWPENIAMARSMGMEKASFYIPAHGELWDTLSKRNQGGKPIELVSLTAALKPTRILDNLGGPSSLADIYMFAPTDANFEHHIELIRESWCLRQIHAVSLLTASKAADGGSAEETIRSLQAGTEEALRSLSGQAEGFTMPVAINNWLGDYEEALRGEKIIQHPTGITLLDDALGGGLGRGWVVIVGGRPKSGKTALVLESVVHMMGNGLKTCIVSLEMDEKEMTGRMLSSMASVPFERITNPVRNKPSAHDLISIKEAAVKLNKLPCHFAPEGVRSIGQIEDYVDLRAASEGVDIVVVDFIQLVEGVRNRGDSREREVASISAGLKRISRKHNCIVFGLSQLTISEGGQVKYRDSQAMLQDCHAALLITENGVQIGAGRQIQSTTQDVPIKLNGTYQRFELM